MKQVVTKLDKIIIMCRNIYKTTALYSYGLGLKVYLQSDKFVYLRDSSNMSIYLQQLSRPSDLTKGYSPMLSFKVDDFEKTRYRLYKYGLLVDGGVESSEYGKVMSFMGNEGEMITINDFSILYEYYKIYEEIQQPSEQDDKASEEIKRLLRKIKF